ncbi:hypothetical protein DL93DRAFT_2090769 [Clavulina sp. PMI_390]|nr:hypothetical protein DL93DRAFT_2090769 [Clavulina sp. PMI_390]
MNQVAVDTGAHVFAAQEDEEKSTIDGAARACGHRSALRRKSVSKVTYIRVLDAWSCSYNRVQRVLAAHGDGSEDA